MSPALRGRFDGSKIFSGSAWILVGIVVQAGFGFLFWLLASRVATASEVGRASALFTAIQFVNYASGMGLTVALARHATGTARADDDLFGWSIVATVVSSIVVGAGYLALVDTRATAMVTGNLTGWVVFCCYSAATSVSLLVDVRLMAARRFAWLVVRIGLIALVRMPLVLVDRGGTEDLWLYHLMLAPMAIGGVVAALTLPLARAGRTRFGRPRDLRRISRYAGVNWVATLASQAPQFVLPLLVAQHVSDATYGAYFLAWVATALVMLAPAAIAQVLLVEGAKDADAPELERVDGIDPVRSREAFGISIGLAGLAFAGSLVVAAGADRWVDPGVLADAAATLPKLMVAGLPWAIASVRLSEARIRRDQLATVAITAMLGLGIVVPALWWVPADGVDGAVRAWWVGNGGAALVAVGMHQRRRRVPRLAAASGS